MAIKRPDWLRRPKGLNRRNIGLGLTAVVVLAIFGGLIYLGYQKDFTGFGPGEVEATSEKTDNHGQIIERTTTTTPQDAKTLWDWANLAGVVAVPLLLAWFGFRLQAQQQKRSEEQSQVEREIADENRQEEVLQNYFDRVSALLVDKNLLTIVAKGDTATPEEKELLDVSVDVIRARTLTTLRRLDNTRKTSLIQFLLEAEVITRLKLNLDGVYLEGADLSFGNLEGAILNNANLKEAVLYEAELKGAKLAYAQLKGTELRVANLEGAYLFRANLEQAILIGANLKQANLFGANLEQANLGWANLKEANLCHAVLIRANLSHAEGLSKEQLEGESPPYLCQTKLPDEIDIDPNRDCERWERDLDLLRKIDPFLGTLPF